MRVEREVKEFREFREFKEFKAIRLISKTRVSFLIPEFFCLTSKVKRQTT